MPLGIAHKARLGRPGARYYAGPGGALTSEQMFNGGSSANKERWAQISFTKDFPGAGKWKQVPLKKRWRYFKCGKWHLVRQGSKDGPLSWALGQE
ncbi:hypothetical protein TNIN_294021 [Trichonephila inaurata madagascariensis]|uniref:Uncharacterized protein n=1 Tax=Trichonephila inaurata madagascariensis TaxID=2747483 RepID=A0A8X6WQY2_9ARAC|nr:hypothetical protein TNIN_491391 [Trichonephila inaurata madagascariensis]GFY73593.1 hypothetical protein TNIN_294021 [Trichonephila inaurata madagascariensis]